MKSYLTIVNSHYANPDLHDKYARDCYLHYSYIRELRALFLLSRDKLLLTFDQALTQRKPDLQETFLTINLRIIPQRTRLIYYRGAVGSHSLARTSVTTAHIIDTWNRLFTPSKLERRVCVFRQIMNTRLNSKQKNLCV